MRLPKAIRPSVRVFALAALSLAGLSSTQAQYAGGPGDGFSSAGVLYLVLDGHSVNSPAYTAGGNGGDGYDSEGLLYARLDGIAPPEVLYRASIGGGMAIRSADGCIFPSTEQPTRRNLTRQVSPEVTDTTRPDSSMQR